MTVYFEVIDIIPKV